LKWKKINNEINNLNSTKGEINKKLYLEAKVTNSFRATPSTGLLTIPSDNKNLYAANFVYYPNGEDKFGLRLNFIF